MINTFSPKSKANDLGVQLDFLWDQLEGKGPLPEKAAGDALKASTDIKSAAEAFELKYERHAGPPQPDRVDKARNWLTRLGSGSPDSSASDTVACTKAEAGSLEVTGEYSLPVTKKWYTSNPEWFSKPHHDHAAADIPVPEGTSVFSMTAGKVIQAPVGGECGNGVTIDAGNGIEYTYCHGSDGGSITGAKINDTVKPGQLIMHSDNTGHSSGTHLHVQIKVNGTLHCPQKLFEGIFKGAPVKEASLPTSGCTY
jgi:murein DD-endopeptidase MepM/ murein hydrolase activator NlpD